MTHERLASPVGYPHGLEAVEHDGLQAADKVVLVKDLGAPDLHKQAREARGCAGAKILSAGSQCDGIPPVFDDPAPLDP